MQITSKDFYLIPLGANKIPISLYPRNLDEETIEALGAPKEKINTQTKKKYYIYSWPMYYKYYQESGKIDSLLSKYPDWGIVTGRQPNGKCLVVIDQDSHGQALSNYIVKVFGDTFTMSTPSGRRHFYYYSEYQEGKEVLKGYAIDDEELKVEFLCSTDIAHFQAAFKGTGREVVSNIPIREFPVEMSYLREQLLSDFDVEKLEPENCYDYSNYTPLEISDITELPDSILEIACQSLIYPLWTSNELKGNRDDAIKAINGYMLRLGYSKDNIKFIINWINKTAEPNNPSGNQPRNVKIAGKVGKRMFGKPTLIRLGFNEFVNFLENNSQSFQAKHFQGYSMELYPGVILENAPGNKLRIVGEGLRVEIPFNEVSFKELIEKGYIKECDVEFSTIFEFFQWVPV